MVPMQQRSGVHGSLTIHCRCAMWEKYLAGKMWDVDGMWNVECGTWNVELGGMWDVG